MTPAEVASVCYSIRAYHRRRMFFMVQRKRGLLAAGAFIRSELGWSLNNDAAENARIKKLAGDILDLGERIARARVKKEANPKRKVAVPEVTPEYLPFEIFLTATFAGLGAFISSEGDAKKQLGELAETLPVWETFAKDIRGFGAVSLGCIIGEAGDLSRYATHSKLWKRMGLAVMDGVRQGGLPKTAPDELWIKHGYNGARRSQLFVVGDAIEKNGDEYRAIYLARKAFERTKAESAGLKVVPAAQIPKGSKDQFMSEGHVRARALRYMEKRLLRRLWQAWRRAGLSVPEMAGSHVPSSNLMAAE